MAASSQGASPMPTSLAGWSPIGILAAVAIVAGIVLLVVYAMRRGLVDRAIEGDEAAQPIGASSASPAPVAPARAGRVLGIAGTALLVVGLFLGLATAITGWGNGPAASGLPGGQPGDCAQSWNGCVQPTPVSPAP